MKFILGKKMSMTQLWQADQVLGVTPVLAGPCVITQIKTKAIDGYDALQLAWGEKKEKNIRKPQLGHVKKLNIRPRHLREFRLDDSANLSLGDVINVGTFAIGDIVNVTATSKGRGFQGVVKRHGFAGQQKTHGTKDQLRMPGSIGPMGPAHVFKGMKMGGRMGGQRITTLNLEIVKIDTANGILFIKGAIPGAINGLVMIKGVGDLQVNTKLAETKSVETPIEAEKEVKAEKEGKDIKEVKEEKKVEASPEKAPVAQKDKEIKEIGETKTVTPVKEEKQTEEKTETPKK